MKHSRNTLPVRPAWAVFPKLPTADAVDTGRLDSGAQPVVEKAAQLSSLPTNLPDIKSGSIRVSTLSFTSMSQHGDLLVKFMRARKKVFIDKLQWDLPQTEGMEFDQYDTPQCRWVIIHEHGEILGGFRLLPTTAQCGIYSYMLRDGQLGVLEDFPTDVLFFEAPVEKHMWEASRLFISNSVQSNRRSYVQYLIMRQMLITSANIQARHVIGIVPAIWSRWLRRLGLYAVPVGRRFKVGSLSSQAALFSVADQLEWAMHDHMEIPD